MQGIIKSMKAKYVRSAPLYMEAAVPMKRYVLVHAGLNCFDPEKGLDEYSDDDLLWTRPRRRNGTGITGWS